MKTILFQGDSITDASRVRESDSSFNMGHGYPTITSGLLGAAYPGEYRFVNRGISGNRIVDVYARIKADIINLKPDVMSILIGVNDVWHEIDTKNGVDAKKFGMVYDLLISEIKAALPDIKIMILTPFVLCAEATKDHFDEFRREVKLREEEAIGIAEKYGLPYIVLQKVFDDALKLYYDPSYWTFDGVHPMAAGHMLIAEAWKKCFDKNFR